ncbi:TonB-dependent receptor [Caulobacter sp. S45]|uniref:TonB-dependent receptor n=1 Tax=Caulobacter sp. S45 TaxID=1641861 RepID=UPI001576D4FE|nr:TonB-dependent receptor [Caulobacter sp. S45]
MAPGQAAESEAAPYQPGPAQAGMTASPSTEGQSAAGQATTVDSVVVTAPRQEGLARLRQYDAPNLISVQSADTISKYPDFNAAEALGRIPGVSLSSDTGEGRFVNIRGIDANLDGATYGGVVLLNTNPGGTAAGGGGRAVEFDTIPTGAIDGIVVTYTGLPDHEAEGLGGQIDLTPRSAAGINKPFFEGTVGEGYEPLHGHSGPFSAEGAVGARFGFDGTKLLVQGDGQAQPVRAGFFSNPTPFSFVITASTRQDRRGIDDLEESYVDDATAQRNAVSEYDLRRYDYHRRRYGEGLEFDFQPNDHHSLYVRADIAGYNEAVHKNFLLFRDMGNEDANGQIPVSPSHPNALVDTTTPTTTLTDEQEAHRNQVYVIGGKDDFGPVSLDYHAAYSRATYRVNYNIGARFAGPANTPIIYDNRTSITYPSFSFPNGINLNDPSIYTLSKLSNNEDYDADEERTYAANLFFPLHLINDNDRMKIGGQARIRDKVATEYDESYSGLPDLTLQGISGPANTYYDGHYPNGPFIDRYAVRNLIATLPNSGPVFNDGSFFNADENIYAAYLQYTTEIGPLGILAGVRVEDTNAKYGGYVATTNIDGSSSEALEVRHEDYVNAFPTVQLRYTIMPRLLARATFSTGISRPGFNQNTTATSVDLTQSPVTISEGNPNLKPTTGQNYDLDLEYYMPNSGIVEFALFDKEFSNYIVPRVQNGVSGNPLAQGSLANITTYENISSAHARGIQADYHQKFTFLIKPLDGFGLDANVTVVQSRIEEYTGAQDLTGQPQYGLLPGTSQTTWNLAAFYEAYGAQVRLAAEQVSHSLFGLGGDKSLDVIQDGRTTLDLTSSYQFTPNYGAYFEAKNLLNTPLRYYEGSSDRPIQREFYDVTIEGGVRVKF